MATLAAAVVLFFLRGLTVLLVIILCGKVFWNWPLNMRHVILSRVQVFIQPYPCSFSISPPSRPGPKWCGRWNMPRMLHKHLPSLPGRKKNTKFPTKKGAKNSPTWFWCAASKTVVPEGTDTWSRIFSSHPNKETDHGVNGDTFARLFLRAQVKFKHFDMFQVSIHHDNTPTPATPFASNGLGTVFREPSLNLKWKPQLWGRKSWNFHPKTTPWNASLVIQICPEVLADLFCIFIHNCRWKMMLG